MSEDAAPLILTAGPTRLELLPALGGTVARFATRVGDAWIDWLRPTPLGARDAEATSCFPLVPFSNRVRQGRFSFGGRQVSLPMEGQAGPHYEHGFGWRRPWAVLAREADRATIEYRHAADAWPFPFRARQSFVLAAAMLAITIEVANLGAVAMPAGFGLHPYFPRTPAARLEAQVRAMWTVDAEVMPVALLSPPPVAFDPGRGLDVDRVELDNAYAGWSGTARIAWPEHRAALTMQAEAPLRFLVVYTPRGEPYFCAEPVSHCTDAFNLAAQGRGDTGMIVLQPGQAASATVRFTTEIERS
ncbi:MAG: aldose 1-epimerase [Alphaproteobacteria bacterium]|nr:aldose 1-epimerase [Alphaproteobacteria bacterium]